MLFIHPLVQLSQFKHPVKCDRPGSDLLMLRTPKMLIQWQVEFIIRGPNLCVQLIRSWVFYQRLWPCVCEPLVCSLAQQAAVKEVILVGVWPQSLQKCVCVQVGGCMSGHSIRWLCFRLLLLSFCIMSPAQDTSVRLEEAPVFMLIKRFQDKKKKKGVENIGWWSFGQL